MIQNLTKLYEGAPLSGVNSGVIYLPILFDCNLQGIDILTDENVVGDCVFSVSKNGVLIDGTTLTVSNGTRIESSGLLDVDLVKGDELSLNILSGALNSPITMNAVADDGASGGMTTEQVQDIVAAMMTSGGHTSWTYNDAAGTLSVDAVQLTDEEVQDKVGALLSGGANTTVTYNDGANTLVIAETAAGKTTEEIQDIIGALLAQGSNVTLTYDDAGNTLTVAASAGSSGITQNSQSADYALVLGDAGKHLYHPSSDATARVFTIPANSSVAFPVGTAITFVNDSAGAVSIAITTDTLVFAGTGATGTRTLSNYGIATILKVTSTRWIISGTNLT